MNSEALYKGPKRLENMFLSPIRQFNEKASALQQAGHDIVYFTMGEPDFNTPQAIKDATVRAITANKTHYAAMRGDIHLREEIAKMLQAQCGVSYAPATELIVTSGAAEALNNAIFSAVGSGDEAIFFAPAFMHYTNMITAAGATPVPLPTKFENGFQPDLEMLRAAITDKTRMLLINNPGNPTGAVYPEEVLAEIAKIACEHDLLVISDEIYNRIVYKGAEFRSIASFPGMRERTLLVNGFSKTFAMTGWRLAYIAADARLIKNVAVIHQYSTTCSPTFIQAGTAEAMNAPETETEIQEMLSAFARRRELIVEGLSQIDGLSFTNPMGAFYVMVNVSRTGMDGSEFANRLLEEQDVAVVPAIAFGVEGKDFVRMSFATSDDRISEGLRRIGEFVARHI